ncbi:PhzF family phenazine biosynthesis protein [Pseudonocardia sp. ICBG1142]|uniref:PhzF family phenazine biosynthesis protein n=1 Tax=Pseudonocardia sp. ICBG1142 TaxID=2846760 RepID=UPI001CF64174|nr:PhzF family phenazine biosynthesis isomerase [Pseudonocardia sp. ICBG1142]
MRHHVVDVFADDRFAGNPAAVVVSSRFPSEAQMQRGAHRIGLPTTAYLVPDGPGQYQVRWFTPFAEINLCGHATIAAARVLFDRDVNGARSRLTFTSRHGVLHTERVGNMVSIDLPAADPTPCSPPPGLVDALGGGTAVGEVVSDDDLLVELASPAAVAAVAPDYGALARLPFRGHIVTARADDGVDFVSRTFFPSLGVDEDQVCVTAHTMLAPYWSARLGRSRMTALQLSERGGRLVVDDAGDRVKVLGSAVRRAAPAFAAGGAPQ